MGPATSGGDGVLEVSSAIDRIPKREGSDNLPLLLVSLCDVCKVGSIFPMVLRLSTEENEAL